MTTSYKNALAEVNCILNITSEEVRNKIPKSFLEFIKENMSKDYIFTFNKKEPLAKQPLMRETKAIISLIYRSYLCSPSQCKRYKIDDIIELKKQQLKLKKMYNYENLFSKKK